MKNLSNQLHQKPPIAVLFVIHFVNFTGDWKYLNAAEIHFDRVFDSKFILLAFSKVLIKN